MEKLKPCPFCGAPAHAWEWNGGARVECTSWDCRDGKEHYVAVGGKTMEEAIERWNRRAEDVQPVKHGRWIRDAVYVDETTGEPCLAWFCNQCGEPQMVGTNFCPNCGAKMDGEDNG